ncbi:hypothetical protein [Clostridium sp.]|uniref:hypothetical protein n=1 Tax=Clostridium sp. TaxID=1506 RepID=UPI002FC6BDF4
MEGFSNSFTTSALNSFQLSEESSINIINDDDNNDENLFNNNGSFNELLNQYKSVMFNSLITAFGLDQLLFKDKDGGNVQTMHNAENHVYANDTFRERGERAYNRNDYAPASYMNGRRKRDFNANEKIYDCYTGRELPKDGRAHLEHIVSAKENHDRTDMRMLFTKDEMANIINSEKNTAYIDGSMNESKSEKPLKEWEAKTSNKDKSKTNGEYYNVDSERAHSADERARKSIDQKVARKKLAHYSSSMAKDGLKQGGQMAIRQALGVVFTEVAATVMDEVPNILKQLKSNFSVESFFEKVGELVVEAFQRVKLKMKDVLEALKTGFTSGVFSSITTTIINMFATTAKNIVRLIRQAMVSITEAVRILFFDKEERTTGERVIAASKVLITGASTVLGVLVEQSLSSFLQSSGIAAIPIIGGVLVDIIPIFAGTILTGLLSVTFIYYMDHAESIQKLISFINKISEDCFDRSLKTIKEANRLLDEYISELCSVDIEKLREQVADIHEVNLAIHYGDTDALYKYCDNNGINLQFHNTEEFVNLMLSSEALEI